MSQSKYRPKGLNAGSNSGVGTNSGPKEKCTKCGYTCHTIETCFQIHGEPEWYKELKKKKHKGVERQVGKAAMVSNVSPFISNGDEKRDCTEGTSFFPSIILKTQSITHTDQTQTKKEMEESRHGNGYKMENKFDILNTLGEKNL